MKNTSNIFVFFLFFVMNIIAQNNPLKVFTLDDSLPNTTITDIQQDAFGYLWMATNTNGITKFDGENFTTFTTKNGLLSNNTNALVIKNDSILIGTKKGLSIKYKNTFNNIECPEVTTIYTDKNTVFVGTVQGIYFLKKDYLLPLKIIYAIDLNHINTIKFDNNFFWIGTKTALWRVNNLQNPKLIKKINSGNYTSIQFLNNKVLAASSLKGIKLISKGQIVKTIATTKNIQNISVINKQLWIATKDNGIDILQTNDFSFVRSINKYNTANFSNKTQKIYQDKQDNTWVLCDKLYQFKTSKKEQKKPVVFIEKSTVNYQPLDNFTFKNQQKTVLLKPNQNNLSFTFKTVDINHPKSIQYRWKLTDKFTNWNRQNTVNFANLSPGNYTFTVQSRNSTKQESAPVAVSFYIDTPIYKKLSFQLIVFALLTSLLFLLIFLYINKIKKKNAAKVKSLQLKNRLLNLEQKALQLQMNPHFIFNVLNGIKALGTTGKTKELSATISKFANLLRGILHSSRQEEISLSEEIKILKNYLDLEQQMHTNPFEYSIETNTKNIDIEEILIPPMLLQPFVENSIKHGITSVNYTGEIIIKFNINNSFLQCTITDNGIGYKQSTSVKNHQSVGIKVTKERIKNLTKQHRFNIEEMLENSTVKGTKVTFQIPLKTDY